MKKNLRVWAYFAVPGGIALLIVTLGLGVMSWSQMRTTELERDRVSSLLAADKQAHIKSLGSWETTEVVIPAGPKGLISYYWVKSGASRAHSLDEYKTLVKPLSRGAEVETPVEGDHFLVPWMSN